MNKEKSTLVYLSDGNGSGPAGVYLTENATFNSNKYYRVDDESVNTAYITSSLMNKTYYLWPVDKAGNRATTPTLFEIKNVDTNPPVIKATKWIIDSDVSNTNTGAQGGVNRKSGIDAAVVYDRSRKIRITIVDNESGMKNASYCFTTDKSCNPNIALSSLDTTYEFTWPNSKSGQRLCYKATDNVNNQTGVVCTDSYLVDGTPATLNSFSFDDLRTISVSLKDNESGVYKYNAVAKNTKDSSDIKTCSGFIDANNYT